MKKSLVFLVTLVSLVGLVSLTSCKKEESLGNGTQFRATMEGCTAQDGKTALDISGTALNWVSGDQIAVYGTSGCGIYTATPQNPATTAVFDNVSGETGDGPFRAFYPATLTTDGVNITLPATQTYVEGSINEFPMYAESSNEELSFKNLCGVLKLHLTKTGVNISSITVTAANEINGTFSVSYNGGDPELTYSANGTNSTTLTCATAQSIADGKDFYVYLPENVSGYGNLRIVMATDDGRYCVKTAKSTSPVIVERSKVTSITIEENKLTFRPVGSKGGLFTINADGDQVWFSQGNLQYQASTGTWRFAENQYDYVGDDTYGNVYEDNVKCSNNLISSTYGGWMDLFGWGTGNNPTVYIWYWLIPSDYAYRTFVDWGTNVISNGGGQADSWRTLSENEWLYLLQTRNDAVYKRGYANIDGIKGTVLLPDNWELPAGLSFQHNYQNNTENVYTSAQWARMEAAGAVFIPWAGYRVSAGGWEVRYSSQDAYYWTSTPQGDRSACYIYVPGSGQEDRSFGCSVRLVQDNE